MTKNGAIHAFFSSMGLPAYPDSSVPSKGDYKPEYPYLVYSTSTDVDLRRVAASCVLWYRSESLVPLNQKVDEISAMIGTHKTLECDEGGIVVRRGSPWAIPTKDDSDDMVKGKTLNFEFLFVTEY